MKVACFVAVSAIAFFFVPVVHAGVVVTPVTPAGLDVAGQREGLNLCPTCISFTEQSISQLLNIIANVGVIGGCGDLCGALTNSTHNKDIGAVCNLLCDVVGIKVFVELVQKADLDPFYFCEEVKACPYNDNADAKIVAFTATPNNVTRGQTTTLTVEFSTTNGTSTGEFVLQIATVDKQRVGIAQVIPEQQPGSYKIQVSVDTHPASPDCDPTQQTCENWLAGSYPVEAVLCAGECGSKHPHSKVLFTGATSFTVTEN